MGTYRVVWALLMLLVVVPGFVLASSTELQTLHETAISAVILLEDYYYMPRFLAFLLSYPVAVVATLLPGSSSLLILFGDMIWRGLGVIFLSVALVNVQPPFYEPDSNGE